MQDCVSFLLARTFSSFPPLAPPGSLGCIAEKLEQIAKDTVKCFPAKLTQVAATHLQLLLVVLVLGWIDLSLCVGHLQMHDFEV